MWGAEVKGHVECVFSWSWRIKLAELETENRG